MAFMKMDTRINGWWRAAEKRKSLIYAEALGQKFRPGQIFKVRHGSGVPGTVCMAGLVNERIILKALHDFGDMRFDVFQLDDGWQLAHGDWEANSKFPSA